MRPSSLQLPHGLKGRLLPEDLVVLLVLLVQKIEIEMIHAAVFKLFFKQRADIRRFHEAGFLQFVGKDETLPRKPFRHAFPESGLRPAVQHIVGGVEIIESRLQEDVRQTPVLLQIHLSVLYGQARAAEAEIALYLREKLVCLHTACPHSKGAAHPFFFWCVLCSGLIPRSGSGRMPWPSARSHGIPA